METWDSNCQQQQVEIEIERARRRAGSRASSYQNIAIAQSPTAHGPEKLCTHPNGSRDRNCVARRERVPDRTPIGRHWRSVTKCVIRKSVIVAPTGCQLPRRLTTHMLRSVCRAGQCDCDCSNQLVGPVKEAGLRKLRLSSVYAIERGWHYMNASRRVSCRPERPKFTENCGALALPKHALRTIRSIAGATVDFACLAALWMAAIEFVAIFVCSVASQPTALSRLHNPIRVASIMIAVRRWSPRPRQHVQHPAGRRSALSAS